jgi:hypothetical protein
MKTDHPVYVSRANIIQALPPGLFVFQIAKKLHQATWVAAYWCRKLGYRYRDARSIKSGRKVNKKAQARQRQILIQCASIPLTELQTADQLGLTKQRVSQLYMKYGIKRTDLRLAKI